MKLADGKLINIIFIYCFIFIQKTKQKFIFEIYYTVVFFFRLGRDKDLYPRKPLNIIYIYIIRVSVCVCFNFFFPL